MDYLWMAPPFKMKPFVKMNKKEAQQHFDWYLQQIPLRIQVLYDLTNGIVKLDYSKESLIDIFKWYLSVIEVRTLTDEEIQKDLDELRQYPDFIYEDEKERLLQNPVDLEVNDYALAMDIAIYYAETIIKHNTQVQWTFLTKPKSYIYLNESILHFEDENVEFNRNPRQLLNVIIQKIKKNKVDEQHLYNRFLADESLIIGENHFE